jgi:hypothetical protein
MNNNNIITIDKDVLNNLSDEEVIKLWENKWVESKSNFCKRYQISKCNFSRCVNRKKDDIISVLAIKEYLSGDKNIYMNKQCIDPKHVMSIKNVYSKIIKIIQDDKNIDKLIFVDGDNVVDKLNIITLLNKSNSHTIICYTNGYMSHLISDDRFTIFNSITAEKDAADIALSSLMYLLNIYIRNDIIFYIISSDRCFDEVSAQLTDYNFDRFCIVITKDENIVEKIYSSNREKYLEKYSVSDILNMSNIDLKILFNNVWNKDITSFCKLYDLNIKHFVSWKNRTNIDYKPGCKAVIKYLTEYKQSAT